MRGKVAYVFRDPVSFETHAFTAADYRVLVGLNGERTLGEVFESLCARGICTAEREESYYRFVLDLHRAGLLSLPISDERQLQARHERRHALRWRSKLMSPLYLRVPVWNPDPFLAKTVHLFTPLFTRGAFIVWCLFNVLCAILIVHRRDDLAAQLPALLAPEQLLSMWVLLTALKVVHEFGHGYAVRAFGGVVPEMGVSLILFTPCAYVDASSSWSFSSRLRRMIVCMAGVYFESWFAGLGLIIWAFTDAGATHELAYQTMVLASVTTLGFNLNPLLRYDGYFILSDLLQVPNLRQAAQEHCLRVVRRIALGINATERPWGAVLGPTLVAYAIGASFFRVGIVLGMCAVIATKFLVVGMTAAIVYGGSVVIGMLLKTLAYLWVSKETAAVRHRAVALGVLLLVVPAAVIAVPVPRSVYASGVVERERIDPVNLTEGGIIGPTSVHSGARVDAGQTIVTLASHEASERLAVAEAERRAAEIELEIAQARDAAQASIARGRVAAAVEKAAEAKREVDALVVRAPSDGDLTLEAIAEEPGRALGAGARIATIESGARIATLVLDQHSFARLQGGEGASIELRSHAAPSVALHGTIRSIAPAGSDQLASAALSVMGGGTIPVSPVDGRAEHRYFEVKVRMAESDAELLPRGARVEARLPGERESLARRWYGAVVWFNEQLSAGR